MASGDNLRLCLEYRDQDTSKCPFLDPSRRRFVDMRNRKFALFTESSRNQGNKNDVGAEGVVATGQCRGTVRIIPREPALRMRPEAAESRIRVRKASTIRGRETVYPRSRKSEASQNVRHRLRSWYQGQGRKTIYDGSRASILRRSRTLIVASPVLLF